MRTKPLEYQGLPDGGISIHRGSLWAAPVVFASFAVGRFAEGDSCIVNRFASTLLIFGMFGLALFTPAEAIAKLTPESKAQMQLSFAPLVKQAAPAVVNIYTRRVVEQVLRSPLFDDPFFRRFFGERFGNPGRKRQQKQNSLGSGVLLTADGMIVTNHHVIHGADEITVALSDRREFDATPVSYTHLTLPTKA